MKRKFIPILFLCVICATISLAFENGKKAYTKRYQTSLLKDPQPLAESVATLQFGTSVQIVELKGKWANVSADTNTGWIYLGNLSEDKPAQDHSVALLNNVASDTTAAAAARPLDSVTLQFAQQEGLGQATNDLQWLDTQSDKVTKSDVEAYLKQNKKGEYQ